MYLLLGGENDERRLLDYLTKDGSHIRGAEADDDYHLGIQEVLDLRYDEATSFLVVNQRLGELVTAGQSDRKLHWKTEFVHHQPFIDRNQGKNVIDPYLSPVIVYQRPYWKDEFFTEACLFPAGGEANSAVKRWYERVGGWCRRRATNVFSGMRSEPRDLFPGQFISFSVNTRWAFAEALGSLAAGRMFCEREYSIEGVRRDIAAQRCATHIMARLRSR